MDARVLNDSQIDLASVLVELAQYGPPSEILRQAPTLASRVLRLDRTLLCSVRRGVLFPEAFCAAAGEATKSLQGLQEHPVALEYPLFEGEVFRRRRPQLVHVHEESIAAHAFADLLGWRDYVTAPLVLDTRVIGFLHGDRVDGSDALTERDAEALGAFAVALVIVFERAALRMRLRAQQNEMHRIAAWAEARTGELGERLVSFAEDAQISAIPLPAADPGALRDLLTRREIDVLELMVRGVTNRDIATELVLSTGTIKFHVKNILRKLHAANRAEATSRYLRLTLDRTT